MVKATFERELKLEADPGFTIPDLGGKPLAPRTFTSTYYDTPARRLLRSGITLRRRVENRAGVWQLKLPSEDGRYELEQKAKDLKVTVTDADVAARLKQIKAQYFKGSEANYKKQLKAQGLTEPQLKLDLHAQILSEKLYNAVTGKIKVTDAEIAKYYKTNQSQYGTAASRDVRHILVNNKKLADQLETQLKNGGNFGALAKKYSKDPGSAKTGGKLTITKGQTVPEFDKAAFALKTNETSPPIHTQYGWHIIQALSAVKPATTTPLASVKTQISQQLLQSKRTAAMTKWLDDVKKGFAKQISYQAGYVPESTAATGTAAQPTVSTATQ